MTVDQEYNTKETYINHVILKTHPRKLSLEVRQRLVEGLEEGLVAREGLIAHGRGEAFDYLLGEKTAVEAMKAMDAAVALLLLAENPVVSVNGNVAALCPRETVKFAKAVGARIEVNLFYRTVDREKKIASALRRAGARKVYGVGVKPEKIKGLKSKRGLIDKALWNSDVVFVPLEDGDRTEALVKMGKKVITVDLNPMSRTSRKATITIVDNVVRAMPYMTKTAKKLKKSKKEKLEKTVRKFNNKSNLNKIEKLMRKRL